MEVGVSFAIAFVTVDYLSSDAVPTFSEVPVPTADLNHTEYVTDQPLNFRITYARKSAGIFSL